jgi:hypothetical protein
MAKHTPPTDSTDEALADSNAQLADLASREEADSAAGEKRIEARRVRLALITGKLEALRATVAGLPAATSEESDGLLGSVTKAIPQTAAKLLGEFEGLARVARSLHSREVAAFEAARKRYAALRNQVADRIAGIEKARDEMDRRTAASLHRLNSAAQARK